MLGFPVSCFSELSGRPLREIRLLVNLSSECRWKIYIWDFSTSQEVVLLYIRIVCMNHEAYPQWQTPLDIDPRNSVLRAR